MTRGARNGPPIGLISEATVLNAFRDGKGRVSNIASQELKIPINYPFSKRLQGLFKNKLLDRRTVQFRSKNAYEYFLTEDGADYLNSCDGIIQDPSDWVDWATNNPPHVTPKPKQPATKDLFSMDTLGLQALPKVIEETGQMMTFLQRLKGQLEDFIDTPEEIEEAESE